MMLSSHEKCVLQAAAEAIVPKGTTFPAGGKRDVERLEEWLAKNKSFSPIYRQAIRTLDTSCKLLPPFTPFHKRSRLRREKLLQRWQKGNLLQRSVIALLALTVKATHFDDPEIYARYGCVWDRSAKQIEPERYRDRIHTLAEYQEGEVLECEAVVVGTGSGGAVIAKELAQQGIATLILEEGKYWTRKDYTGRLIEATEKFYRNRGFAFAFGNTFIMVPQGRMVGGSTAINTGTCWRTPPWILQRWAEELKLRELAPEKMAPYFERVEQTLRVETAKDEVIGGIAKVIGRGCDPLGYRHFPLKRNAPDCDGQGVCDAGCPTGARRSTEISYLPLALQKGAELITEAKVVEVLIEKGKARGVKARSRDGKKELLVRAKVVVLACGAIMTPALLLKQGIANESGYIGKNLTLHPCMNVCALFENDEIAAYNHAPQGYCVDTFHREGILLMGAGLSLDAAALAIPLIGKKFSYLMSRLRHLASFGVQVEDSPSGRVFLHQGKPRIFYWLKRRETDLLKRGAEILARIYLAAGAKEVYPFAREADIIRSPADLERFRRASSSPTSFRLVSFHPLGTCRMGRDPRISVIGPTHQSHSVKNLYICDGSAVPTSVAVNPQETIMALATRAAECIASRF